MRCFPFIARIAILATALSLSGCINLSGLAPHHVINQVYGDDDAKKIVPIIKINGFIIDEEIKSAFINAPNTTPARILSELNYWKSRKEDIGGLVLLVNSGGGSAAASDMIYSMIQDFKKQTGLPVVAVCTEICASGAYYISLSADRIYINPLTVIGSIGVISIFPDLQGLLNDKLGVNVITIKSGSMKDSGSPFRKMTVDEQNYFQTLISTSYARFKSIVLENRKIDAARVDEATDGRVFDGPEGIKIGLADGVGYYAEALEYIKAKTGVKAKIVSKEIEGGFGGFLGADSPMSPLTSFARLCSGRPLYLHVTESFR